MLAAIGTARPLYALMCPAIAAGLLLLLADVPLPHGHPMAEPARPARHLLLLVLLALAGSAVLLLLGGPTEGPVRSMNGALTLDGLARVGGVGICASAALAAIAGYGTLSVSGLATAEFLALLCLSTTGALCIALASDLLALFLGIELMSMAAYVLTGYRRSSRRAQEAALKYYLMGAFASALMVFGMALLWGEAGRVLGEPTFTLRGIASAIHDGGTLNSLGWVGAGLWMAALLFKCSAVPFHMWTPDVYQGAPTASTAFFAGTIKLASFVGLTRLAMATVMVAPPLARAHSAAIFAAVGLVSIVVGNLLALRQMHIKRLLAYSSVAHAGYALLGLAAACADGRGNGLSALYYYLVTYAVTVCGCFAVVCALEGSDERRQELTLDRLVGAARSHPLLAAMSAVGLFALAGIPPTAGFVGKFAILQACLHAGLLWTALAAAVASAVGAYAYLRVLNVLFFRSSGREVPCLRSPWLSVALAASLLLTLLLGIAAEPMWAFTRAALATLPPYASAGAALTRGIALH